MSSTINTADPAFYAELLMNISRPANRRLSLDGQLCSLDVDDPLLDAVANISRSQRKNVSATMASLKAENGTLVTQLYIVFNHGNDNMASHCSEHLQSIFDMLRKVPSTPPTVGDSPKDIKEEMKKSFLDICKTIHNYSFPIFAHRVTKYQRWLPEIQGYIEQDQTPFSSEQRSTLVDFLQDVKAIITLVEKAKAKKAKKVKANGRLTIPAIEFLVGLYSYWTEHGLLPKDPLAGNRMTLLDAADQWLADEHGIQFDLRRWMAKIMSLVISANSLFTLIQSRRLRKLLDGRFLIEVLPSPPTTSYQWNLSLGTVSVALDAALAGTRYASAKPEDRNSFIESLLATPGGPDVDRKTPRVHAELALIMAMAKGEIQNVEPYIGVSKLSCMMCSHYIDAFNDVTGQKIATRGCHGKAYARWFWPNLPSYDSDLRPNFLGRIKKQLVSDFEKHVKSQHLSDSSVGSDGPKFDVGWTRDKLDEMRNAI